MKQFTTTNSKGKRFFLKFIDIKLRTGVTKRLYYLSNLPAGDIGRAAQNLPPGAYLYEERLGYLRLKKRQLTIGGM